jgi:hypothetical protein
MLADLGPVGPVERVGEACCERSLREVHFLEPLQGQNLTRKASDGVVRDVQHLERFEQPELGRQLFQFGPGDVQLTQLSQLADGGR